MRSKPEDKTGAHAPPGQGRRAALLTRLHAERAAVMQRHPPYATQAEPLLLELAAAASRAGSREFLWWKGLLFPLVSDLSHTHVVCPNSGETLVRVR